MENEFVPYEETLALHDLGFNGPCCQAYYNEGSNELSPFYSNPNVVDEWIEKLPVIKAPLYQQAFRWFREKYGYFQLFDYQHGDSNKNRGYFFNIINIKDWDFFFPEGFEGEIYKTYEEAELECLRKLIEIVNGK